MPSGAKKRRAAKRKQEARGNLNSNESALQGDDFGLEPSKENTCAVAEEFYDPIANPNANNDDVSNSNKENLAQVLAANDDIVAAQETPESVSNENGDRIEGLHSNKENLSEGTGGDNGAATVQENSELVLSNEINDNSLIPSAEVDDRNSHLFGTVNDVECLKRTITEGLHAQDKMRELLQNLLDALNNLQPIVEK